MARKKRYVRWRHALPLAMARKKPWTAVDLCEDMGLGGECLMSVVQLCLRLRRWGYLRQVGTEKSTGHNGIGRPRHIFVATDKCARAVRYQERRA